jgi:prevent-host-death family protein
MSMGTDRYRDEEGQPTKEGDVTPTGEQAGARVIGVRELKARASELIREVETTGQRIIISRNGKPRGYLTPLVGAPPAAPRPAPTGGHMRNAYPDLPDIPSEAFRSGDGSDE